MNLLSREQLKILAEKHGWSMARAEGYAAGATLRTRGKPPSKYELVGLDQYSVGFRAGYFVRGIPRAGAGTLEVREFRQTDS